ncbi:MAG TPA: thiamine-phosphate kinase [Verrucomicrobiaceae bacterium]|jgi:thiamine-monophosphate kinase
MKAATLAEIGEDELVRRLAKMMPLHSGVVRGAGDDCAVVKPLRRGWFQLLKTDCVVEGVHFTAGTAPERVGWKALARAISDIAAMGGVPDHAMITLLAPPRSKVKDVMRLYAGMKECAEEFGVALVGGETARAPVFAVVFGLTGRVKAAHWVGRDGAKPGDLIYVTGKLGGSRGGRHLDFMPRIAEGPWLVAHHKPHAMMDLSDGLARDLPRMAQASGVGFVIDEDQLPRNKGCSAQRAWADGEDYELLLAVHPRAAKKLEHAWRQKFGGLPMTAIGRFVPKGKGKAVSFSAKGWEHF